jgi:DNA-binding MarR family transcriptional regulator
MVEEGLIDRITVPSTRGNTICLQLIDAGKALLEKIDRNSQQKNPDNEGELSYADVEDTEYPWTGKYYSNSIQT